jgi:hypothetical protein
VMGDRFEGSESRGSHRRCVSIAEGDSLKGINMEGAAGSRWRPTKWPGRRLGLSRGSRRWLPAGSGVRGGRSTWRSTTADEDPGVGAQG